MDDIRRFEDMISYLHRRGDRKRVAVANPRDESTEAALGMAAGVGFIEPILVDDEDQERACWKVVEMIRRGEADIIMKGLVSSDLLLKAILNRDHGILPHGKTLTQVTAAQIPTYPRLLLFTDPAVIPEPTFEQQVEQVRYVTRICHIIGNETPRVSLIHCNEHTDPKHFPVTANYTQLKELAAQGEFGSCIVDGPLDLRTSCDVQAMHVKGINSPIDGQADCLIMPNIETGNLFYKSLTFFAHATMAAVLQGSLAPVAFPSRGDDALSKYYGLALAAL